MAASDFTEGLEPSQISTSNMNGLLYLDPAQQWRWRFDGTIAQHVRSARLGTLLPRFHIMRRYNRTFLAIPYAWRDAYDWQRNDLIAGGAVDTLVRAAEQALVRSPKTREDSPGHLQVRLLGGLVKLPEFDAVADRKVASWSAKDAMAVYAKAQARILYLDDEDVQRELDTVYQRFLTREAVQRFGDRECDRAVAAWLHICHELRLVCAAGTSRYRLWHAEHAMSKAWEGLPSNFWRMSKTALHEFAQRYAPTAKELAQ